MQRHRQRLRSMSLLILLQQPNIQPLGALLDQRIRLFQAELIDHRRLQ